MNRSSPNIWLALAVLGGMAYPFIVYLTMGVFPLWFFLLLALGVMGLRLWTMRQNLNVQWTLMGFGAVALALGLLFIKSEWGAVQAYPVIVSLTVAAAFGWSLLFPPTLVERIARLSEPALSAQGIAYTRRVTWLWFFFLLMNATVSLMTVLWGTLAQWMLWNGFVSYLLMGALFAGEYVVRKIVRP